MRIKKTSLAKKLCSLKLERPLVLFYGVCAGASEVEIVGVDV